MDPVAIEERLNEVFSPDVVKMIVDALTVAYTDARELHSVRAGSNRRTFGFNLYEFVRHQFGEATGRTPNSKAKVRTQLPLFRMLVGDVVVGCHRLGGSRHTSIAEVFPTNRDGAGRLCPPVQTSFDFMPTEPVAQFGVIIAHVGTLETGLESVFLAVPASRSRSGKIDKWLYTKRIWSAIQPTDLPVASEGVVPEEKIARPTVARKSKAKQKQNMKEGE